MLSYYAIPLFLIILQLCAVIFPIMPRLGIAVTVTRGSLLSLRRGVGVYTAFMGHFWSRRSPESVQQRYSRLGRCGLCLLGHTTQALIWAVARVSRCHPHASRMSCILVQTCGLTWASMGAQSLLGSRVKLLRKCVALTYYTRNCAYANSCLLCFKLCQHNLRMSKPGLSTGT